MYNLNYIGLSCYVLYNLYKIMLHQVNISKKSGEEVDLYGH